MTRATRSAADYIPFGAWLMERLDERSMRRIDLADAAQVRSGMVSRWLYRNPPEPFLCERIAGALMIPVDEVLVAAGHRPPDRHPEGVIRQEATNLLAMIPEPLLIPLIPMLRALADQRQAVTTKLEEALDRR